MGNLVPIRTDLLHDDDAEVAVLGSVLLSNEIMEVVRTILEPADFFNEKHSVIYHAMVELHENGDAIDHVILGNKLKARGDWEKVGGFTTLMGLTDKVAAPSNFERYASIVYEKSAIRKVMVGAQRLIGAGTSGSSVGDIEGKIAQLVDASIGLARTKMPERLTDMGGAVVAQYKDSLFGGMGVPHPWDTLTRMTSGMWPKTMTFFVARPGTGKTFICIICARNAWMNHGKRVLIVSPEMSKLEIAERFFVIDADVSYLNVVRGELSDFEIPKLEESAFRLKGKEGLWVMDGDDDLSPRGIEAAIRACKPDLVAVDSIYDLKIKGERRDRLILAVEWAKKSAKKNNYAFVGFAQQNRDAELAEKKGGGSRLGTIALADELGQDAHAIYALEQTKEMKSDCTLRIIPLKIRRGKMGSPVLVRWDFDKMLFDEIAEEDGVDKDGDRIPF